jgi:prepilin-type N-terminal cleavage/methylation domain-containing protein
MNRQRGYTIIELMMALTVLAIGVSGVIAMQKITITSNQHAKSLATATHIAQAWQERLAADAAQWNHPSPRLGIQDIDTDTRWLREVVGNEGVWFRPAYDQGLDFGPGFDALGNVVAEADIAQAVYCTHLRLTRLYPDTAGNGLLRAEIRVFWARDAMGGTVNGLPVCAANTPAASVEDESKRYRFVYQTTAVKQNTAQ